jgi:hypothetical protein
VHKLFADYTSGFDTAYGNIETVPVDRLRETLNHHFGTANV